MDEDQQKAAAARILATDPFFRVNEKILRYESAIAQYEWLKRSEKWSDLPPDKWKGKSVLGIGGHAIVGLWEYQGADPQMPKHIVVKQVSSQREGLKWESNLLRRIMTTGTNHIVKLYKSFHQEGGTGASSTRDALPYDERGGWNVNYEVSRIYLEYLDGGTLLDYIRKIHSKTTDGSRCVVPEEHLWRILGCIAKAIMVLEHGSEDPTSPNPDWQYAMAHFDMKGDNLIFGSRDQGEHKRIEVLKLVDFGLALPVPKLLDDKIENTKTAADFWLRLTRWRGCEGYLPPEQYFETFSLPQAIHARTNVWLAANQIYSIVVGRPVDIRASYLRPLGLNNAPIRITGDPRVLHDKNLFPYSKALIDTLCQCLVFFPSQRTSAAELLSQCNYMLGLYNIMTEPMVDGPSVLGEVKPNILVPSYEVQDITVESYSMREQETRPPGGIKNTQPPPEIQFPLLFPDGTGPNRVPFKEYPFSYLIPEPPEPPQAPRQQPPEPPQYTRTVLDWIQGTASQSEPQEEVGDIPEVIRPQWTDFSPGEDNRGFRTI